MLHFYSKVDVYKTIFYSSKTIAQKYKQYSKGNIYMCIIYTQFMFVRMVFRYAMEISFFSTKHVIYILVPLPEGAPY
jgi:hypothetical protein